MGGYYRYPGDWQEPGYYDRPPKRCKHKFEDRTYMPLCMDPEKDFTEEDIGKPVHLGWYCSCGAVYVYATYKLWLPGGHVIDNSRWAIEKLEKRIQYAMRDRPGFVPTKLVEALESLVRRLM